MAESRLNPLIKDNVLESGITIESGTHVVLHELFLDSTSEFIFIELDAFVWFV